MLTTRKFRLIQWKILNFPQKKLEWKARLPTLVKLLDQLEKQGGEVISPDDAKSGAEILKAKLKEFEIIK